MDGAKRSSHRSSVHDLIFIPTVDADEIKYGEIIGKGACGKVWKGYCREKLCAIKEVGFGGQKKLTGNALAEFQAEVAIMTQLRHPNILLLMGACYDPCLIITELLPNGDLDHYLQSENPMTHYEILNMAKEICEGMNWLHLSQPPIIHKDLKPANILLDRNHRPKIADFGLSVIQESRTMSDDGFVGSALWMAPESLLMQVYNEKVDIYAFSLILWQLLCHNRYPYPPDKFFDAGELSYFVYDQQGRPSPMPKINQGLANLITKSWAHDPDSRPSFKEIILSLQHESFAFCLRDEDSLKLWQKWPNKDVIPFNEFCPEFYKLINEEWKNGVMASHKDTEKLQCLKELIAEIQFERSVVTLQKYGRLLSGFGPLHHDGKGTILDRLHSVMKCEWFHGDITNDESSRLLTSHQHVGEYLVRTSNTEGFPFTLAKVSKKKTISLQRIGYNQKEYFIKISPAQIISNASLPYLLEKYGSKTLGLSKICPRTKYRDIFQNKLDFGGYEGEDDQDEVILSDLALKYGHKIG